MLRLDDGVEEDDWPDDWPAKTGNTALFFARISLMSDIISILVLILSGDEAELPMPNDRL